MCARWEARRALAAWRWWRVLWGLLRGLLDREFRGLPELQCRGLQRKLMGPQGLPAGLRGSQEALCSRLFILEHSGVRLRDAWAACEVWGG
ncbi:hypothetical protein BIFGAL_03984 [Bifidobacterium gallicum DSM 20093 = LMG 11596]|uniref:Uncharacterized protein n=1 Tax=Bifidobacterium gallicum DSM 20093 = LMG 11596 TaxID=561180 RepID=D1NVU1_9BIFI|nr:hypothetical protein BIFGAL_03984 [Bifidobacterium gallicum DSM 20093 = LMG 11596]